MSVTGLLSGSVKRFTGMTHSGRDNRKLLCYVSAGLVALFFLLYFLVSRASTWWMIPLHAKDIPYSYCPVTQRILRSKGVYGLSGRLLKLGIYKNVLGQCYPWLIHSQRPGKKKITRQNCSQYLNLVNVMKVYRKYTDPKCSFGKQKHQYMGWGWHKHWYRFTPIAHRSGRVVPCYPSISVEGLVLKAELQANG